MLPYIPLLTTTTMIPRSYWQGGGEFLRGHHEAPVAREAYHRAVGMDELRGECGRKSVPHAPLVGASWVRNPG